MLFAVWTENRATEETERISVRTPSIRSVSLHELSRTNTTSIQPIPLAGPDSSENPSAIAHILPANALVKEIKMGEFEVMEEQRADDPVHWGGGRPPVFKSTFWEICCIVSIVCGQLTNVLSCRGRLLADRPGTCACTTNHDSCIDSIFSFYDGSASLGERCAGNSGWMLPSLVWTPCGYFRTKTRITRLAYLACPGRGCLWSCSSCV